MRARSVTAIAVLVAATAACAEVPTLTTAVRWAEVGEKAPPPVDLSQRKQVVIRELPSAPEIDGRLDDPAWRGAARTDTWMVNTGEAPAPVQTTAWLGTHDGRLHLGIRADEPNPQGLVASVQEDDGPVWSDDCIELFVDGNLDLKTARQLVINSIGTVATLDPGVGEWDPPVTRAAVVGEDAWSVELALPLSSLGITGSDFGLNLCRERRAGGETELSCWSPTGGSFHQPSEFGLGSLPGGFVQAFGVGEGTVGHNRLTVTLENPEERELSLRPRLTWWQGESIALERTLGPFSLQPGETREVSFGYDIREAGAPVQLELAVLDEGGRVLAHRQVTQSVQDVLDMAVSRRVLPRGHRRIGLRGAMHLQPNTLADSQVVLALFTLPNMLLVAREEIDPQASVMCAELQLPNIAPGDYSLHLVLKRQIGHEPRRIAEEKITLVVLEEVAGD
ncbi:MAG: sugar-binding protein [Armatimonadota bacterium]